MAQRVIAALGLTLLALISLGGCQVLGPTAINEGRGSYNDIIQSTSMNHTLANIVRVYKHEPTQFMDVTAVNASTSFVGSVNGGTTNIGARTGTTGGTLAGQVGSVGGAVQYSETPTITYTPLTGQALVSQLATPVSVEALADLSDSHWELASILDLAAAYMTVDAYQHYSALDAIIELDSYDAINLAAGNSELASMKSKTGIATSADRKVTLELSNKSSQSEKKDTLIIFFEPNRSGDAAEKTRTLQLWARLLSIYAGTQRELKFTSGCKMLAEAIGHSPKVSSDAVISDPDELRQFFHLIDRYLATHGSSNVFVSAGECLPGAIELRTQPVRTEATSTSAAKSHGPVMRTYSALGIIKKCGGTAIPARRVRPARRLRFDRYPPMEQR
jgi:hypothetical protein